MLAPSATSLAAAGSRLDQLLHPKGFHPLSARHAQGYGEQFFAFTDALLSSPQLTQFCVDQSFTNETKHQLLERITGGKADPEIGKEFAELVNARWRRAADFSSATESLGVQCVIAAITSDRRARKVEDQLIQLSDALKDNYAALSFLNDASVPTATREKMIVKLLDGKADAATELLAIRATVNLSEGRFLENLSSLVSRIAASRNRQVAKVTSAIELTDHQVKRLEKALSKKYGIDVEVSVSVDPAVIGGLRVELGNRIMDDTVRARLYDAERRFSEGTTVAGTPRTGGMEFTNG